MGDILVKGVPGFTAVVLSSSLCGSGRLQEEKYLTWCDVNSCTSVVY